MSNNCQEAQNCGIWSANKNLDLYGLIYFDIPKNISSVFLGQNYTFSLLVRLVIHGRLLVILKSIVITVWSILQISELKYIE